MDKRSESIYLRLPDKLKQTLKERAKKNMRSINDEVIWNICKGLHADDFNVGRYVGQQHTCQQVTTKLTKTEKII